VFEPDQLGASASSSEESESESDGEMHAGGRRHAHSLPLPERFPGHDSKAGGLRRTRSFSDGEKLVATEGRAVYAQRTETPGRRRHGGRWEERAWHVQQHEEVVYADSVLEAQWVEYLDEATHRSFWFNQATGQTAHVPY
jgi:hypothetical protein